MIYLATIMRLLIRQSGGMKETMQMTEGISAVIHGIGAIGWLIVIILIIFLFYKKNASWASRIYAIGSSLTFGVMRFPYQYFYIYLDEIDINWTSPFVLVGLVGGYGLILISILQYRADWKSNKIDGSSLL